MQVGPYNTRIPTLGRHSTVNYLIWKLQPVGRQRFPPNFDWLRILISQISASGDAAYQIQTFNSAVKSSIFVKNISSSSTPLALSFLHTHFASVFVLPSAMCRENWKMRRNRGFHPPPYSSFSFSVFFLFIILAGVSVGNTYISLNPTLYLADHVRVSQIFLPIIISYNSAFNPAI